MYFAHAQSRRSYITCTSGTKSFRHAENVGMFRCAADLCGCKHVGDSRLLIQSTGIVVVACKDSDLKQGLLKRNNYILWISHQIRWDCAENSMLMQTNQMKASDKNAKHIIKALRAIHETSIAYFTHMPSEPVLMCIPRREKTRIRNNSPGKSHLQQ